MSLLTIDGASLTKARLAKAIDQAEVARNVGVNKSQICRWEQGITQPPRDAVFALVEFFGVNDFVRLNGKAVLTAEEIEVVRKLREG